MKDHPHPAPPRPASRLFIPAGLLLLAAAGLWLALHRPPSEPVALAGGLSAPLASAAPSISGQPEPLAPGAENAQNAEGAEGVPPPTPREPGALTDRLPVAVASYPGKPLVASVQVEARRTPDLVPNQVGEFPTVYLKPGQKVSIRLRFPEAEAGSRASVSVEDGGFVGENQPALPLVLDDKKEGEFDFTAGAAAGRYRVVVRQGADVRFLVLWAEA